MKTANKSLYHATELCTSLLNAANSNSQENPVLLLMLSDLLADARKIKQRLELIDSLNSV